MNKKVLLFGLLCISVMVFFAWKKLNPAVPPLAEEQKKQAFEKVLGRAIKEERVIPQGENTYEGKFFSLSYPAYAKLYDRDNVNITNNTKLLEYLRLDSEEPNKFKFVVMVGREDGTAVLEELSGVRTRRLNKRYIEKQLTLGSNAGVLFVKTTDGVERSSFFLINGRSYSFVITGFDAGELEKIYGKIMESLLLLK